MGAELLYTIIDTPLGPMYLGQRGAALYRAGLVGHGPLPPGRAGRSALLDEAARQLAEYFAGQRRSFTLPLAPEGTAFQRAVWQQMAAIPYGETRSYGALAAALGRPGAARAVGGACNKNPLMILLPCHRVVGSTGALTGFAPGLCYKEALLRLEAGW